MRRVWTVEQLQELMSKCPNLSDLGTSFPLVPLMHNLEDTELAEEVPDYHAFAVCHGYHTNILIIY
jgi:hypothetical protein